MIYADICENANLSKDYKTHSNFRPILFSHGNKSAPSDYTALFSELASRGFIVFAPFHRDRSCKYTERQDGTPMYGEARLNNADLVRWEVKT